MIPADLALALAINRAAQAYTTAPPVYITYDEYTHVTAPALGRTQDINRHVVVRQADDYAIMRDLPNGGESVGKAFPIVPYFDPFSQFNFSYFANFKQVTISLTRGKLYDLQIPQPDASVDAVVPYFSEWTTRYAPDSTPAAPHIVMQPTQGNSGLYVSELRIDAASQLPSHIELRDLGSDQVIALDYAVVDGRWMIVHGTFSASEHAVIMSFGVVADVTYRNLTISDTAPDPRLAGSPPPTASTAPGRRVAYRERARRSSAAAERVQRP